MAISGVKNSGKTTLMEKLIRTLSGRSLQVAAVKHDGHDFTPDVPAPTPGGSDRPGPAATPSTPPFGINWCGAPRGYASGTFSTPSRRRM